MLNNLCKGDSNNSRGSNIFHLRQLLNMAYLDSCTKKTPALFPMQAKTKTLLRVQFILLKMQTYRSFSMRYLFLEPQLLMDLRPHELEVLFWMTSDYLSL